MDRRSFADDAALTDTAERFATVKTGVLRQIADDRVRMNTTPLPDHGISEKDHCGCDVAPGPNLYRALDDDVRPDRRRRIDFGL